MLASSGEITPPCGVPASVALTVPCSITPASNHRRNSFRTLRSEIRSLTGSIKVPFSAPRTFRLPTLYARSCPTKLPGRVSPVPLLPSPCYERLGSPKHLSANNLTRLRRSPIVAARWFAPLLIEGLRHSARLGRISPPGRSRALQRLPGQDFQLQEQRVFQDAP